ncbi:hypothetical protein C0995_016689 [Termitomyces sp. Mi166|nr:hypothetical protein C0995_016689 [Termitomyces sp. Mi166\
MDNALAPTMGMMSKESHPFCIKPQLVDSSSQRLEDMNFDIENEILPYSQPSDLFPSPTRVPMMDTVDWASSQPVALKSLLSQIRRIPEKRPINSAWSTSDAPLDQVASTSRASLEAKSRPLRRTNSSARARLSPEVASTSSNPPPAPDGAFWGKDRLTVLVACQNVSERMDESVFALAAQAHNTAPPKLLSKRKPKGPHLTGISKTRHASTSHSVIHEREGVSRWEKGKQRSFSEAMPTGMDYQRSTSVPRMTRSLQRVASSSSSAGSSTHFSSSKSDTSMMDIDTELRDETPPTSVPVSPFILPVKRPPQPRIPIRSTSTSSTDTQSSAPAPQPHIQLHPLLTQKQKPKQDPFSNTAKQPFLPQNVKPPPSQGPLLSQSTRPPPLGMRRGHTVPVTTTHVLPTRQKAFKPPLLSQPARPQHKTNIAPTSVTERNPRKPSPEPEMNGDPDSSFGDISLGMDEEELELTMRQYD